MASLMLVQDEKEFVAQTPRCATVESFGQC
jgi:hypothetical protein